MRGTFRNFHHQKWLKTPLVILIIAYFCLVTLYSSVTPLLEAPDAYFHFAVIEYIGQHGERPPIEDSQHQAWRQMTFHAPLYYFVSAALIAPIDTEDFISHYPRNPHAQIGEPHAQHNQNFVAHAHDGWSHTGLAIHIVQLFSMFLGVITLGSIYFLTRYTIPSMPQIATLAGLLVVLNPQFLYMSGVVSNDNLVVALTSLGLALIVRVIRIGTSWQRIVLIAIVLALNSISKASGLTLYPMVAFVLTIAAWRDHRSVKTLLFYATIGIGIWLAIAGWWYADNLIRLEEPFGATHIAEATGIRSGDIDYTNELRGLFFSFWGLFGWFNVIAPLEYYYWMALVIGVSSLGGVFALRRIELSLNNSLIGILMVGYTLLFILSWRQFNVLVPAAQGRLWFPLMAVGVLGMSIGLGELPLLGKYALFGGMATAVIGLPFLLIRPTFQPSDQFRVEDWSVPTDAALFVFREPWKAEACLNMWVNPPTIDAVHRWVEVRVAYEARCRIEGYWSRFIHLSNLSIQSCLAGDTQHILVQNDSMPDGGKLPLPALKVKHVAEEVIRLEIPPDAPLERITHLQMGFYDANGTFIRMQIIDFQSKNSMFQLTCGVSDAIDITLR